jgi:hypothetical protein
MAGGALPALRRLHHAPGRGDTAGSLRYSGGI